MAGARLRLDEPAALEAVFLPTPDESVPEPVLLAQRNGGCVFFEPQRGNVCAIHRQLGAAHLPSACRHFPRVVVLDPRGVFLSLSYLCPTAGRLLIEPVQHPFSVVSTGAVIPPGIEWEGLDARDTLPPRMTAGILWDWDGLTRWELGILQCLATTPLDNALVRVARAARAIERWRPPHGKPLADHVDAAFECERAGDPGGGIGRRVEVLDSMARASAQGHAVAVPPLNRTAVDRTFVEPGWRALQEVAARYVATRAVANWAGYHASSASSWAASLLVAAAVLRTEAARQCAAARRVLDSELLVAAAGEADRLLVHMSSAAALARLLDTYVSATMPPTRQ